MSRSPPLPPLAWLRAFEAAGRHSSFKLAAEELNVSPSTISHQIRDLESLLGVPLFSRGSRATRLTREGEQYLQPVTRGFSLIRSAQPGAATRSARLRVGGFPFFINEVLAPELATLRRTLNMSIELHTQADLESLLHADPESRLDVVVRYSARDSRGFPGLLSLPLFQAGIVPIVSPDGSDLRSSASLLRQPLIRVLGPFDGWQRWCEHFAIGSTPSHFEIETDSFHTAALAVERGDGVCLGVLPYMKPWIDSGRVRALSRFALQLPESAFLVYAPHNRDNPAIGALGAWLQKRLS